MKQDERLVDVQSNYLCPQCKSPLYIDIEEPKLNAVCPNGNCSLHPSDLFFFDVSKAEELKKELQERQKKLDASIANLNKEQFTNYLYRRRFAITKEIIMTGKADFRELLALDALFIYLNNSTIMGHENGLLEFDRLFNEYEDHFGTLCFVEDLLNERYLISTGYKSYTLKYWPDMMRFLETQGIVAGSDKSRQEVLRFQWIDNKVKEHVPLTFGSDWGKYFQQMFDFIISSAYMFECQYITKLQHAYNPTGIDLATIIGLALSAQEGTERWSLEGIRQHYHKTSQQKEKFGDFFRKYISGRTLAPIIIWDGKEFLFDKSTLLIYGLYLIKTNKILSQGQTSSGEKDIASKKGEASLVFEAEVRQYLSQQGFKGSNRALIVQEHNEKHEYDAIGVKEDVNQIIIGEAKYRDFAPSSICGRNLVKQELVGEDKLLDWVSDAESKLQFFRANFNRFKKELNLLKKLEEYTISMMVITKYEPLIAKYHEVDVLSFEEFCEKIKA